MHFALFLYLCLLSTSGLLVQSMTVSTDALPPPPNPTWTPSSEPTLQPWPTDTDAPPHVPQESSEPEEPITAQAWLKLEVHKSCSKTQKRILLDAWAGALYLDHAQQKYVPGGAFSAAMRGYFGRNVEQGFNDCFWPWCIDYKARIGGNLARRHKLDTDKAPASTYLYFYCEDFAFKCTPNPTGIGYSVTNRRGFWTNHYIVFCDQGPFYGANTLAERLKLIDGYNNLVNYKIMEHFQGTREEYMYHEQMHMYETVCYPFIDDYAYRPLGVWNLAKNKGCYWSSVNADSYTLAALAIYIQDRYQLELPPVPWEVFKAMSPQDYPPYPSAFNITTPSLPYLGGDDGALNSTLPPGLTYSANPDDPPIMAPDTWTPFSVIAAENDVSSTSSSATSLSPTSSNSTSFSTSFSTSLPTSLFTSFSPSFSKIPTSTSPTSTPANLHPICKDSGPFSSASECNANCLLGYCTFLSRRHVGSPDGPTRYRCICP